ncbi:hypothetical protein YC2023_001054 [Brassica napus]
MSTLISSLPILNLRTRTSTVFEQQPAFKLARTRLSDGNWEKGNLDRRHVRASMRELKVNLIDNVSLNTIEFRSFKQTVEEGERDKVELKAIKEGAVSYASLEKKAQLYEKLRGSSRSESSREKKATELNQRRKDQATNRREKLKQAYLWKQLEKLKAQQQPQ